MAQLQIRRICQCILVDVSEAYKNGPEIKIVEMMEGEWGSGCLPNSIPVDPNSYNICVIFLREKQVFIFLLKVLLNVPSDSYVKGLFMYLELIFELAILCIM